MAVSLIATGVQFPDSSVQTTASSGSGVSSVQASTYSSPFSWPGASNPIGAPITVANEFSSNLNLPSFTYDFNNMIYIGYQFYANASTVVFGPTDSDPFPSPDGGDRAAPVTPVPGQVFYRILYRTA